MKIKEKILLDRKGLNEHGPINIAIFGDSVSHGALVDTIDHESVYAHRLKMKLHAFRDYVPINIINASIGGETAKSSLPRLTTQVLCHQPDLVIISFGLNDVNGSLEDYLTPLGEMFDSCKAAECDTIFLTPNMLNTYVADDTPAHRGYAEQTAKMQNEGRMDQYMTAAKELAEQKGVTVCDCYARWKALSESADTTMLLVNRINHPTAQMHQLFADALYDTIMQDGQNTAEQQSTMFETKDLPR